MLGSAVGSWMSAAEPPRGAENGPDHDLRETSWYGDLSEVLKLGNRMFPRASHSGQTWSVRMDCTAPRTRTRTRSPDRGPVSAKADRRPFTRKNVGFSSSLETRSRSTGTRFSVCEMHHACSLTNASRSIISYHMADSSRPPTKDNGVTGAIVAAWRSEISPACISRHQMPAARCELLPWLLTIHPGRN